MSGEMHMALHQGKLTTLQVIRYGLPKWVYGEAAYVVGRLVDGIADTMKGDECP